MSGYAVKKDGNFRAVEDESWCVDGEVYQEDQPKIIEPPVDTERLRRLAYADPDTGSDRYFAEAMSLIAAGSPMDSDEVRALFTKGLEVKAKIKEQYP
jgi:hypothetical protein